MKIKTKLTLGVGLLFIMIIVLSFVGTRNINALKNDTENILTANYNTLEYSRNMLLALDATIKNDSAFAIFNDNLNLQEKNITESGEREFTDMLALHFQELKSNPTNLSIHQTIRKDISNIMKLNMQAIERKSKVASETARTATLWISMAGALSLIIGFILLVSFPGKIANPLIKLDVAKANFIGTVSHELKTPIAAIKMSLQLLENKNTGAINQEQQQLIDGIREDSERLLKITGELLNLSQVETGNIQLTIIPSVPKDILIYSVNANKIQAEQKQIKFEINCPEIISKVLADSEKTAWVITNLISNAIRYSFNNSIIYLSIEETENKINFSIKDTGQGIAPEYKVKIFERYFRVPGTMKEGTGLGLAISKEFIEAQGGYITLESELGTGSTFIVTLNKA